MAPNGDGKAIAEQIRCFNTNRRRIERVMHKGDGGHRLEQFTGNADFEGVFAHSYKRWRPRLFLRALRKE